MAWVPVTVNDRGQVEALVVDLRALAESTRDMSEPLTIVIARILGAVRKQYETAGAEAGYPWAELTPKYRRWKEKRGPGLPLLFGLRRTGPKGQRPQTYAPSGRMLAESTSYRDVHVSPTRAIYAPLSETLGWHEFGTTHMVARPPVLFSRREEEEWPQVFVQWINAQIVAAGL